MNSQTQTKEEFLAVLAHELRNPLATIMSSVELMNVFGMEAKETSELLSVIDQKVREMSSVLDNLLDTARVSPDKVASGESAVPSKKILAVSTIVTAPDALKVLVVDDNENAADSLSQLLALRGYSVVVAYSGAQALEKALIFQPQVAILDIGMPDMDGYELARMLQKEKLPCVYIALTGYGQTHDKQNALAAGFDYHLTKPAGIKEIEAILKKIAHEAKKEQV